MLSLLSYMKKNTGWIVLIFALLLLQVTCDLAIPGYTADIVDIGIRYADSGAIVKTGMKMLFMVGLSVICTIAVSYLSSRVSAALSRDLREQVYEKVLRFSNQEMNHFSTASLITRSTNDITQIQNVVGMTFRVILYAPILGIGGMIRAARIGSDLWWTIALAVMLAAVVMTAIIRRVMPSFEKLQQMLDRVNLVAREILSGVPVIRSFSRQGYEQERFNDINRELAHTNLYVNRMMLILTPAMTLIMNGLTVLILFSGAHEAVKGGIMTGDIMAFIQYAAQIVNAFVMIASLAMSLPRAAVCAKRITEILDMEPSIKTAGSAELPKPTKSGILEFREVSFRYPGAEEDALKKLSFTVEPGAALAIVGSTGSGKSTLLSLVLRLQDAASGQILWDGIDIKEMDLQAYRKRIGYVPQKSTLFSGTVRSNLQKGKQDAADEEMEQALKAAQALAFVNEKGGLGAEVVQGGANFSGGQKQRLSIARAIVRKPECYLFDDCFSALDAETEARLRAALDEEAAGAAVLIVSQQVSTIRHADRILVLEDGGAVGYGTHEDLLENCAVYREIAASQLAKEALTA